ncbi:hypothetical protein [Actinoallomurus iriomotensis]|uniref:Uncharacterized protein n=1 Tax=Actinoallomurus iriomotensis TaxID=478107 RepID=A0A9W6VPP0_9ACTN|nr:hypothetical protein [Actinoallomurus iriomotensis]GLY73791.1 hypothetical protein Airi01_020580 [Actinoallomurus iriomotensis]
MGTIELHHQNIDEAADALTQASNTMHQSMDDCLHAVTTASADLVGDMQNAANDFYTAVQNADRAMTRDINRAADILREMHGLLRDADRNGAGGFHH